MDADKSGLARTAVGEAVWHACRADDDVAWTAFEGLIADPDQDVTLQDYERLVVRMVMQVGPFAGRLCTRKNDTDDGPYLPPSKVREMSLPGRLLAFTWYMDHAAFR